MRVGTQARYYGLLFMLSAILIYFYVLLRDGDTGKTRWAYRIALGVVLALTVMTGYSTIFWLAGLFLIDTILIIKRELPILELSSYGIGAFLCLPWGLSVIHTVLAGNGQASLSEAWPAAPTLFSAIGMYSSMATGPVMSLLYLFSVALLVVTMVGSRHVRISTKARLNICLILSPAIFVMLVYAYSVITASHGSLMVDRYIYQAWPMLCVTMAQAVAIVLSIWRPSRNSIRGLVILSVVIVWALQQTYSFIANYHSQPHYTVNQPYAAAAAFLSKQPEISSAGTIVYLVNTDTPALGWEYFYVTEQGTCKGFKATNDIPYNAKLVYVVYPSGNSWTPYKKFAAEYTLVDQYPDVHISVYQAS